MHHAHSLAESSLFVNGERRAASGAASYALHNPARPDELVGHAARATVNDVNQACTAANQAFPAWRALSYAQRADYLRRIAAHLTADEAELDSRITLFTREHGKVLRESRIEMSRLGDRFLQVASYAERLAADEELPGPPFDTRVVRQPRGVAALVVPWNWPLSILGAKLPQALMAGNTVVIKLPENSAMAPAMTVARIAEILPPGVVNVLTGSSSEIGDALLAHPVVRLINFTGSIPVGRHVMAKAAERLLPVTLELGGNDAALVLEDAVLDADAFNRMYLGAFMTSGQICMALKRLYVHRSRYDEVVDGLSAVAARQVVGDGLLADTTMGPLNNRKQLGVVTAMLEQARSRGADVKEFGEVPDEELYRQGYFQRPTLVLNPDHGLDVVREEQFGPILPILPFDSIEDGIAYANDTRFGLCSSVWTADMERADRVARELVAGYTYINNHGPMGQDNRGPFGGFKESGIGRNLGFDGVLAFMGPHTISAPTGSFF